MKTIIRHLNFFAPAAVLSAWGTVMIYILVTGRVNQLLTPMFRDYVLVAGVLLLVFSVAHLMLFQPIPHADAAFPRQSKGILKAAFLVLPLLFSAFMAPSALSITTFENRSDAQNGPSSKNPASLVPPTQSSAAAEEINALMASDPTQPVSVEVTDLTTLASMPDKIEAFTKRPVKVVGQYADLPDGTKRIYRLLMWCCAADAKPVSIHLEFPKSGGSIVMPDSKLPNGTAWVEVTGKVRYETTPDANGGGSVLTPILHVDSFKPTDEPDEPFLSPF